MSNLNLAANISLKRATEITLNIERKLNNSQRKATRLNCFSGDKTVLNSAQKITRSVLSDNCKNNEQQNNSEASDKYNWKLTG